MKEKTDFEKMIEKIEEEAMEQMGKVPQELFRKEEWVRDVIKKFYIRDRVWEREVKYLQAQLREKNMKTSSVEEKEVECQSSLPIELPKMREEENYLSMIGGPLTPLRTPLVPPCEIKYILSKIDKGIDDMGDDLTECANRIDALKAKIKEQERLRQELLTLQDE